MVGEATIQVWFLICFLSTWLHNGSSAKRICISRSLGNSHFGVSDSGEPARKPLFGGNHWPDSLYQHPDIVVNYKHTGPTWQPATQVAFPRELARLQWVVPVTRTLLSKTLQGLTRLWQVLCCNVTTFSPTTSTSSELPAKSETVSGNPWQ